VVAFEDHGVGERAGGWMVMGGFLFLFLFLFIFLLFFIF
jgi:hypothetical protein